MKRGTLVTLLTTLIIMMSASISFAGGLELVSSYPEDGQENTSMENMGVKLTFNHPINSEEAVKTDQGKFRILDSKGKAVPTQVLFSDENDGLVLVVGDPDKGFVAENNSEYQLVIDAGLIDNEGNTLDEAKTISFKTYNQRANSIVSMLMMTVMFGGIMVVSMRQNLKKDEDEPQEEAKEAFNPYKEAKRTGKSVEEIQAVQAKKEAKQAKKKARKGKSDEAQQGKKIENCAQYLNNVYHVHAPAPVNHADRSIEAMRAEAKDSGKKSSGSSKSKTKKKKK